MAETKGSSKSLVSASDIAEMTGLRKSAVSNWRANSRLGFPDPAGGTPGRPLFDLKEVTAWLTARGTEIKQSRPEVAVWGLFNALRGLMRPHEVVEALPALLCARRMAYREGGIAAIWRRLVDADSELADTYRDLCKVAARTTPEWEGLAETRSAAPTYVGEQFLRAAVDVIDQIADEDLGKVAEFVLARAATSPGFEGTEHGLVGSRTSQLLANAVNATCKQVKTVYDPAVGIGAAMSLIHDSYPDAIFIGEDINWESVLLARRRAFLQSLSATLVQNDVISHDSMPDLRADVVIAEPPFGRSWNTDRGAMDTRWRFGIPPRSSSELLWIQHAIHHLADEGRAFVITSRGPLFRARERVIRTELLRAGCIEAIIGLPGRMLPHTTIPLALWVLRRPQVWPMSDVLFVDASGRDEVETEIGDLLALTSETGSDDQAPFTFVPVVDLLAEEAIIQPERWTGAAEDRPEAVAADLQSAAAAFENINPPSIDFSWPVGFTAPRVVTVQELVDANSASLLLGNVTSKDPLHGDPRVWTVKEVRGYPDRDEPLSPMSLDRYRKTQPGDVVFVTTGAIGAVVDRDGGRPLGIGTNALRVDASLLDPDYLALCLMGSWNARHKVGSVVDRHDVKALEIPVIPLGEQKAVVATMESADEAIRHANALATGAAVFKDAYMNVVRTGVNVEAHR